VGARSEPAAPPKAAGRFAPATPRFFIGLRRGGVWRRYAAHTGDLMSSAINPLGSNTQISQTASSQSGPTSDPLANEQTFLKLLVSQLQNQDPLNPTDSTQFVSQLTSYSQLEQLIGIHKDTTQLVPAAADSASTTSGSGSSSGTSITGN
jgi:flagellar basal-body rod modification protein FlgD